MPLSANCKDYVGSPLFVLPYYGNGWTRPDLGEPPPNPIESLGPEPFHLKVQDLIYCGDELMGATGMIDEPGHPYNGHWSAFYLRMIDEFDFTSRPGDHMVWIARTHLPIRPEATK